MLDVFASFATDESLEENGTEFEVGAATLLIARSGNRAYNRELTKQYDEKRLTLDIGDEHADKVSQEMMIDVMAKTILLGWKNLGYRGKPLDYSVENAKLVLGHRDFRQKVSAFSNDIEGYRSKLETEQGKA